ncbi:MAG: BCCT family transporter [Desulfitobacterium hafniense]|nr:BCCT family transporter [Desulfitobacterium hafniense]
MKNLKPLVFWPPFLLLLGAVILSFVNKEAFAAVTTKANNWILANFSWLFNIGVLAMLVVCIAIFFSPFGKVKIGGSKAVPLLTPWKWFAVTICTSIAIGILFWGTAEPMYHLSGPPKSLGIEPNSPAAAIYAMSTMYLHWTFSPYAIYAVPTVLFAFAYYNMRKPFSLASTLYPLMGEKSLGALGMGIDAITLYALVAGMAASLGTGVLTVSGGLNYLFGIPSNPVTWLFVTVAIVVTFVISAITGLFNGIRFLSDLNAKIFFFLIIWVFIFGPTAYILNLGTESFANYLTYFFQKSLFTGAAAGDQWPQWWTVFYWAVWLAWAPISGVFLGRISYGYSVRSVLLLNLFLAALFSVIWMTIFSGAAIHLELVEKLGLAAVMAKNGTEGVVYLFLSKFPLAVIVIPVFVFTSFLSYVTGADAMTSAMGGMSTAGISPESPEPSPVMKIIWGTILGAVAWVMISFAGIDGIKMISNLGGFPALFLELAMTVALVMVALNPKKYDTFKEDYAEDGTPLAASTVQKPIDVNPSGTKITT